MVRSASGVACRSVASWELSASRTGTVLVQVIQVDLDCFGASRQIRIYQDFDWQEFQVVPWRGDRKKWGAKTYHTDNFQDAINTASAMCAKWAETGSI